MFGHECKKCKHLKTDHKTITKNNKFVRKAECLWVDCKCDKFEPGEFLKVPQRWKRDDA